MGRRNKTRQKKTKYCDYSLFFLVIFLLGFGLVMLYSVSAYNANLKYDGDTLHYLRRQGFAAVLGITAMIAISKIDYHIWIYFGNFAYFLALVLCVAVLFMTDARNGSTRWMQLGPLNFQPSELAKMATILFLSGIVCRIPKQIGKFANLIKVMIMIVPIFVIVAYANLSTAIIIMGIAIVITFVASPKYWQFFAMGGVGIVGGGVLFIMAATYRMDRIDAWLHPENYTSDTAFQTLQGLYAIGSGGLFGKGLGQSMQKLGFVPEAQNDMIFSIICEELGLFGAMCVILLFLLMIVTLTSNIALSTAYANDALPELVFAQQVYGYGQAGSALLGISTSGDSKNVIYALMTAKLKGMKTIGLTGERGGKMKEMCDACICVPASFTPDVQELHLPVYHCLCRMLEEAYFG